MLNAGKFIFDLSRDLFILYADRKRLTPAMIARIETQFHLPGGAPRSKATFTIRAERRRTCYRQDPFSHTYRAGHPFMTTPGKVKRATAFCGSGAARS
jgi:hypothetical protein